MMEMVEDEEIGKVIQPLGGEGLSCFELTSYDCYNIMNNTTIKMNKKKVSDIRSNLYHNAAIQILSFFTKHPLNNYYEREFARESGFSLGRCNQVLRYLNKMGFLKLNKKGRMSFYSLNRLHPAAKHFRIFENIMEISQLVEEIKGGCKKIILFGSCAEGSDTSESDIDLFIYYDEDRKIDVEKKVSRFSKLVDREIKPILADDQGFLDIISEAVWDEIKEGIILYEEEWDDIS